MSFDNFDPSDTDAAMQLWYAYAELEKERDALKLALDCERAVRSMTVSRLGGIVEGNPTGTHNFLQRIDELRRIEETWLRKQADAWEAEI